MIPGRNEMACAYADVLAERRKLQKELDRKTVFVAKNGNEYHNLNCQCERCVNSGRVLEGVK
jgi:hypothetical protein